MNNDTQRPFIELARYLAEREDVALTQGTMAMFFFGFDSARRIQEQYPEWFKKLMDRYEREWSENKSDHKKREVDAFFNKIIDEIVAKYPQ